MPEDPHHTAKCSALKEQFTCHVEGASQTMHAARLR